MRIQLITNLYAPDELAGASLFTDLAGFLSERGQDVRVITTFPYYPYGRPKTCEKRLSCLDQVIDNIPVRRIRMFVPRYPTGKARMLSELSFFVSLVRFTQLPAWKPDIIITALPMLSQCLAQRFVHWRRQIPRIIIVQDFVVEAAFGLGILQVPGLAWMLRQLQRWALRSASTLSTISPLMLKKLRSDIGSDRRIVLITNWIHRSLQMEIDRLSHQDLTRQPKSLLYSGNLGVKQGLPAFLQQYQSSDATKLGWQLDIHGGGCERQRLIQEISRVSGTRLGDLVSESNYVRKLCSTTACLVTQRPGIGSSFLPSKVLPALATGTPVLAVCDADSPLGQEVLENGFGEVVAPGDAIGLQHVLRRWGEQPNLLADMSLRAKECSRRYYRDKVLSQFLTEIELLTQ